MSRLVEAVHVSTENVSVVPFLPVWVPLAWGWLNEFPRANFDDYGPKTLGEFSERLLERRLLGHVIFAVLSGGQPVGIIGFRPVTQRLGEFAGVCFSKSVHGTGVAAAALSMMIQTLWAEGYEKLEAKFFWDNERIAGLFRKLGAHDEGLLFEHTLRGGRPLDMKLVGFLRGR